MIFFSQSWSGYEDFGPTKSVKLPQFIGKNELLKKINESTGDDNFSVLVSQQMKWYFDPVVID